MVEPERMADDDARIKLGRVETASTKLERQPPPRGANRVACEWLMLRAGKRPPRHDGAPSAASNSA